MYTSKLKIEKYSVKLQIRLLIETTVISAMSTNDEYLCQVLKKIPSLSTVTLNRPLCVNAQRTDDIMLLATEAYNLKKKQ